MTEHTPTPWNAASKYSSVVGVPIVNQQGKRVGNTALPGMPAEWDHLKRQAEIDAAFIVRAVNSHDGLVKALADTLNMLRAAHMQCGVHHDSNKRVIAARAALSAVPSQGRGGEA